VPVVCQIVAGFGASGRGSVSGVGAETRGGGPVTGYLFSASVGTSPDTFGGPEWTPLGSVVNDGYSLLFRRRHPRV